MSKLSNKKKIKKKKKTEKQKKNCFAKSVQYEWTREHDADQKFICV